MLSRYTETMLGTRNIFASLLLSVSLCQGQAMPNAPKDDTQVSAQQKDPTSAETLYEYGRFARQDHRYTEALKWYRLAAAKGSSSAEVDLGFMYFRGFGVPRDSAPAARWWELAATHGDAAGEFGVGLCNQLGEGLPQDLPLAIQWFSRAFKHGHKEGANSVGEVYDLGLRDHVQAFQWFSKGAQAGDPLALYNVCRLSIQGIGTTVNYSLAFQWCSKAAESGGSWGQYGRVRTWMEEHPLDTDEDFGRVDYDP